MRDLRTTAIDWEELTEPEFTRAVELLVLLEFPQDEVRPLDGRGGDGGIDIDVIGRDGHRRIFQLKHFVEGFSKKYGDRRQQISRSLAAAVQHEPHEWTLVVPGRLTKWDYPFFDKLRRAHPQLTLSLWTRADLDRLVSNHPQVLDVLRRDPALLEYASAHAMETAVLAGGGADLHARVSRLGDVVDDVDPWWTLDFAREGDTITQTVRAKHPDSAKRSPITVSFTADLSGHDELADEVRRTLGFGLTGSVTLPDTIVKNFVVDGPPLLRQRHDAEVNVSWTIPTNMKIAGKPCTLTLIDDNGRRVAHRGEVLHGSPGTAGMSLQMRFHHATTVTMRLPYDQAEPCNVDLAYDSTGTNGSAALIRRAVQLPFDLAHASKLSINIDGNKILDGGAPGGIAQFAQQQTADMRQLLALAIDIDDINHATGNDLPVPATMSTLDRIWLRCIRLMLAGRTVLLPDVRQLNLVFDPDPEDRGLAAALEGPAAVQLTSTRWTRPTAGHDIELPAISFWHPNAELVDRELIAQRLRDGELVTEASLAPTDDTNFRGFIPERRSGAQIEPPVPWGIDGVRERPPLAPE